MARQKSIFMFADTDQPNKDNQLKFSYDPVHLGHPVQVTFPSGTRTLSPTKLAELGVLCLALAGTTEADNAFELLEGFDLPAPFFMHLELLANRSARRMTQAFIDTYPAVKQDYGNDDVRRSELESVLAQQIVNVMHENA